MSHFYDDRYQSGEYYWGKQPSSLCYRVLQILPPAEKRTLIDIGCGEGRNAIFFARNGYVVTGFDLSAVGIKKAGDWANELDLSIELFQADVTQYRLQVQYDILFSSGTLQYIPKERREELFGHYKESRSRSR
jgi:tellurite methyltransferase